jgi:predicted membrane channel-forming protein YqfA (hemolysin III family)
MKGPLNVTVAVISIFLYSSLACVCMYFALSFWDFETGRLSGGRFGATKLVFFIVLGTSAILDTPLFIWCAALGGPASCEWNAPSYEGECLSDLCLCDAPNNDQT